MTLELGAFCSKVGDLKIYHIGIAWNSLCFAMDKSICCFTKNKGLVVTVGTYMEKLIGFSLGNVVRRTKGPLGDEGRYEPSRGRIKLDSRLGRM